MMKAKRCGGVPPDPDGYLPSFNVVGLKTLEPTASPEHDGVALPETSLQHAAGTALALMDSGCR